MSRAVDGRWTSEPLEEEEEDSKEDLRRLLINRAKLPVLVGLWYFFNVQYNVQNKLLLQSFSATWAVSWLQLASGIPIACFMWAVGLVKIPRLTRSDFVKLVPQGLAHSAGQVATVASLGDVAVSFTHIVKAAEPAVNAIASALILGQVFHPMVYVCLLPVFGGVALASSNELSFTTFGFLTAMGSNFAFVARNVLATKFGKAGDMGDDQQTRKTNQLAVLTMVAAAVVTPVCLFVPGGLLSIPSAWTGALDAGVSENELLFLIVSSGFYFYMYQLSSFWVLSCVPPLTHSVLNSLKRVVVIVAAILAFGTRVTLRSGCGAALAIGGVLSYSLAKAHYSRQGVGVQGAPDAEAAREPPPRAPAGRQWRLLGRLCGCRRAGADGGGRLPVSPAGAPQQRARCPGECPETPQERAWDP